MKKFLLFALAGIFLTQSHVQAAGGAAPCLATFFLGDTRMGLYMNEGKPIEELDWLIFAADLAAGIGSFVSAYDAYTKSNSAKGCLSGCIWGRRAGSEFNTTKIRTKEILMCIPVVNLYPCIALPLEAYSGKTMSQVIQEENLKR